MPLGQIWRVLEGRLSKRGVGNTNWNELEDLDPDRLWLHPLGPVSGRAAVEAIGSGQARPLAGPD
jgi:hypothetical protein